MCHAASTFMFILRTEELVYTHQLPFLSSFPIHHPCTPRNTITPPASIHLPLYLFLPLPIPSRCSWRSLSCRLRMTPATQPPTPSYFILVVVWVHFSSGPGCLLLFCFVALYRRRWFLLSLRDFFSPSSPVLCPYTLFLASPLQSPPPQPASRLELHA